MSELAKALTSNSAFAPPSHIVEGLDEAQAHTSYGGTGHGIYREIWHLAFWQEISLAWIDGNPLLYPEHASLGFPTKAQIEAESWPTLRERFLAGIAAAADISLSPEACSRMIECPTSGGRPVRMISVQDQLISLAAHNAYHLGRVVLMRQLAGAWPPPSGGDTW